MGEVGKDSFISLSGKVVGGEQWTNAFKTVVSPFKTVVSQLGEDSDKFYFNCSKRV